ncbi:hypothetical protein PR048_006503 [Dryococelus australis]|uniref:Uncharacterized protein n=1 Tax=Dryococelus australis TaxID=614101 RepID=A0ABQ9IBU0_9NEOP|nr:hypothetical protein PR048_006503 [Dryococelus australis]
MSHLTKANRVLSPVRSLPDFRKWELCRTMPLGISRFPCACIPALLHTHLASPSSALKTRDIKSRPNLYTHTLTLHVLVCSPIGSHYTGQAHCSANVRYWRSLHDWVGATVAERLASHQADPGSIPGGSLRIFACGNRAGRCCWLAGYVGELPFPSPFNSVATPYSYQSPSSALKTSILRADRSSALLTITSAAGPLQMNAEGCGEVELLGQCQATAMWDIHPPSSHSLPPSHSLLSPRCTHICSSAANYSLLDKNQAFTVGSTNLIIHTHTHSRLDTHAGPRCYRNQTARLPPRRTGFDSRWEVDKPGLIMRESQDPVTDGPRWLSGPPARLPPRRTGFNPRPGQSQIFASGNSAGRRHWSAGFLGDLPFPPPLNSSATPFSPHFTVIGSQDLFVKSRSNLSTQLNSALCTEKLQKQRAGELPPCEPRTAAAHARKMAAHARNMSERCWPYALATRQPIGNLSQYTIANQTQSPFPYAHTPIPGADWRIVFQLVVDQRRQFSGVCDASSCFTSQRCDRTIKPGKVREFEMSSEDREDSGKQATDSGNSTISMLASHQGEPGSIPGRVTGFSQVGIVSDDAIGRRPSRGSPASPTPSFRRRSIVTSITLIGSQDLAVKSHPNPFTHSGDRSWIGACGVSHSIPEISGMFQIPNATVSDAAVKLLSEGVTPRQLRLCKSNCRRLLRGYVRTYGFIANGGPKTFGPHLEVLQVAKASSYWWLLDAWDSSD